MQGVVVSHFTTIMQIIAHFEQYGGLSDCLGIITVPSEKVQPQSLKPGQDGGQGGQNGVNSSML